MTTTLKSAIRAKAIEATKSEEAADAQALVANVLADEAPYPTQADLDRIKQASGLGYVTREAQAK